MRSGERAFVVEGCTVLCTAMDAGFTPESLYVSPAGRDDPAISDALRRAHERGSSIFRLAPGILERVSDTVTPQPVVAVFAAMDAELESLSESTFILVCVDIRDPGNAGTILRSAAGSGADAVVFCDGSVDPYNPKTVRSSAGALFQVPFVPGCSSTDVLDRASRWGMTKIGAVAHGGADYSDADFRRKIALVFGNESSGLLVDSLARLDEKVTIPMARNIESLNVGMSAAILAFEARRQRCAA